MAIPLAVRDKRALPIPPSPSISHAAKNNGRWRSRARGRDLLRTVVTWPVRPSSVAHICTTYRRVTTYAQTHAWEPRVMTGCYCDRLTTDSARSRSQWPMSGGTDVGAERSRGGGQSLMAPSEVRSRPRVMAHCVGYVSV